MTRNAEVEAEISAREILDSALTSSEINDYSDSDIQSLVNIVKRTADDKVENVCSGISMGMIDVAIHHPARIDDFLRWYMKAADRLRVDGAGARLMNQLYMNMSDFVHAEYRDNDHFRPRVGPDHPKMEKRYWAGRVDANDTSNVNFNEADVEEHLDDILANVRRQMDEGNACIAQQALYARFAVLIVVGGCKSLKVWWGWLCNHLIDSALARELPAAARDGEIDVFMAGTGKGRDTAEDGAVTGVVEKMALG